MSGVKSGGGSVDERVFGLPSSSLAMTNMCQNLHKKATLNAQGSQHHNLNAAEIVRNIQNKANQKMNQDLSSIVVEKD